MAKFSVKFETSSAVFVSEKSSKDALGIDDILEVLRPAALALRDFYRDYIGQVFHGSGEFADSIDIEDDTVGNYAFITVRPFGRRKRGSHKARSRAGDKTRKYAKHNRTASARKITNIELGYYLEYGTPRMPATHWMETANEQYGETVCDMVEAEFQKLLERKGLV